MTRPASERSTARIVPGLLTALLAVSYGPGLLRSDLLQGDLPGHLESIRWSAQQLWPLPWGWDPRFLGGAPVGILYPPLLAWLGGGLALLIGAEWTLRVLLLGAILALPGALFAAGRGLGLRPYPAAWAAATGLAVLWLPWRGLGGSLHQTLVAGNAANALALPVLLGFVATLRRALSRGGTTGRLAAALLATALLSHFLVGAACGLLLVVTTAWRAARLRSLRAALRGARIAAVGLLGAMPFLLPFLIHVAEAAPGAIGTARFPAAIEWLAFASFLLLVLLHPRWTAHPLLPALVLLALLYLLRGVVFPLLGTPPWRMEYHRFRLFLYLAGVPALFLLLQARTALRRRLDLVAGGMTVLLLALFALARYDARGPRAIPLPEWAPDGNRLLVLAAPPAQDGSWHGLQHALPRALGIPGAKGLFVEAAPLAPRVFELERIASAPGVEPRWWALRIADRDELARLGPRAVADRFRELAVDRVLAREPVAPVVHQLAQSRQDVGHGFTLYRLAWAPFVSPLGDMDALPAVRYHVEADGSRIELWLDEDRPVRIAVARFSDWRVASGDAVLGTAPPGVLRVEGRGNVVLEVRPRWEEWLGLALGLVTWSGLLWIRTPGHRRRRRVGGATAPPAPRAPGGTP